jgi:hypothetical protein
MPIFENIFKCTKCDNYVEEFDIANIDDTSDKYIRKDCEREK